MVIVKGVISKDRLRVWLQNWLYFEAGDRIPDEQVHNSGPRSLDGITAGCINRIMMDDAIKRLPSELQRVLYLRWTSPRKIKLTDALSALGIRKSEYYRRCDLAVDKLYELINGKPANYANLYAEIQSTGT